MNIRHNFVAKRDGLSIPTEMTEALATVVINASTQFGFFWFVPTSASFGCQLAAVSNGERNITKAYIRRTIEKQEHLDCNEANGFVVEL